MTGKMGMAEDVGPGVRANRAKMRSWRIAGGFYAVAATVLVMVMVLGRREPVAGSLWLQPWAAVAMAALLPLLTAVTMWFCLRMSDEFQRRLIVDAWAASFIAVIFGACSWAFLVAGGVLDEPPVRAVFGTLMLGAGATVVAACLWFQWRRS
ncbi:MAG: hypothetical protein J7493_00430 [Porphyrobacter sp.]|nr:hypothetical protein [Porphyrobacter sp.]